MSGNLNFSKMITKVNINGDISLSKTITAEECKKYQQAIREITIASLSKKIDAAAQAGRVDFKAVGFLTSAEIEHIEKHGFEVAVSGDSEDKEYKEYLISWKNKKNAFFK